MSTAPTWTNLAHCCGKCQHWTPHRDGAAFGSCSFNSSQVGQHFSQSMVTLDMSVCSQWAAITDRAPVTDATDIISADQTAFEADLAEFEASRGINFEVPS